MAAEEAAIGSMLAVVDGALVTTAVEKVDTVPTSRIEETEEEATLVATAAADWTADTEVEEPLAAAPGPERLVVKSPLST